MKCMHPHCGMPGAHSTWADVAAHPWMRVKPADQTAFAAALAASFGPLATPAAARSVPAMTKSRLKALLLLCPCLYNQIDIAASPRGVVHFCEMTLGTAINSSNVYDAFQAQHPGTGTFSIPMLKSGLLRDACPRQKRRDYRFHQCLQ